MPKVRIPIPTMYGGVSKQAPSVRHPNQVATATNVLLSVKHGASKRPGSEMEFAVSDLTALAEYRLHPIHRDAVEKYLMIYGASGELRVFGTDGTEYYVVKSSEAATYLELNTPTVDELKALTIEDYSIILNKTVETSAKTSDDYEIAADHKDYSVLLSTTPAIDSYHQTRDEDNSYPAGYWQYAPGIGTFATNKGPVVETDRATASKYSDGTYGPGGFKIGFPRQTLTIAAAAWTAATRTLVEVDAFANYTWRSGDKVHITNDGDGAVDEWYEVVEKTDDDTIVLKTELSGDDEAGVVGDYIGLHVTVEVEMSESTLSTMHDVAKEFEDAIRRAGATEALVGWATTDKTKGRMTITSPFRGEYAVAIDTVAPDDGYDFTATGEIFSLVGAEPTLTQGTGTPADDTLAPPERWKRVAAPNQPTAEIDPTTMPVQVVRRPVTDNDYADEVISDTPFAYYRLGDAAGVTAVDEMGANDGTYVDTPTLGETGALAGDSDKSVEFNGTSEYINCSTMGNLGSQLVDGLTIEAWVKLDWAAGVTHWYIVDAEDESLGNTQGFYLKIRETGAIAYLEFYVNGDPLSSLTYQSGNLRSSLLGDPWIHIAVTWEAGTDTMHFYKNGEEQTFTLYAPGSSGYGPPAAFNNLTDNMFIGAESNPINPANYWDGHLDEVAIYTRTLTPRQIKRHYDIGGNAEAILFAADLIDWTPRLTGNADTNPPPGLIGDNRKLSDITFHRDRLVLAGDEDISFSQSGDAFNFYIEEHDNIADADPIGATLSESRVTIVTHVVPFRKALAIFTAAGRQFELNAPEALTPTTAAITPTTAYDAKPDVRPVVVGTNLYFVASAEGKTQALEYFYNDSEVSNVAADISAHVSGYIPDDIQTLVGTLNDNAIIMLEGGSATLYIYRSFWSGNEKAQSAWAKYTFGSSERIADIAVIEDVCYMLIENTDDYFVSSLRVPGDDAVEDWEYLVHLDNRVSLTGVFAAGETTWTLPVEDQSVESAVLGPAFGTDSGDVVDLTTVDSTHVKATGDYSAGAAQLGREFGLMLGLSRPYLRSRNGDAKLDHALLLRKLITNHINTGEYSVVIAQTGRALRGQTFTPRSGIIEENGKHDAMIMGQTDDTVVVIVSDSPKPVTIAAGEYIATSVRRSM